jgi:hypothetical protein
LMPSTDIHCLPNFNCTEADGCCVPKPCTYVVHLFVASHMTCWTENGLNRAGRRRP